MTVSAGGGGGTEGGGGGTAHPPYATVYVLLPETGQEHPEGSSSYATVYVLFPESSSPPPGDGTHADAASVACMGGASVAPTMSSEGLPLGPIGSALHAASAVATMTAAATR